MKPTLQEKFDANTKRMPNGCLEWTAGGSPYGMVYVGDYEIKRAHVVAWFLHYGVWPTLFVCHECDNTKCCDWEHLFEGTPLDNSADAARKGRMAKTPKVSVETCSDILRALANGHSQRVVAKEYGIAQMTVSRINTGTYPSVLEPFPIFSVSRESGS